MGRCDHAHPLVCPYGYDLSMTIVETFQRLDLSHYVRQPVRPLFLYLFCTTLRRTRMEQCIRCDGAVFHNVPSAPTKEP
jgi:hypothetical protein